ncbi:MAG: PilZ domain-containing protein [Planktomarina sp.]|nr:PilZ domain-containing protein [Planktomarina sp.]
MIERRQHRRVEVDYWASLKHSSLGTVTADIQEMSSSGFSLTLDKEMNFFVMMELDVQIHGEGWDGSMPPLPMKVVRVQGREIALTFLDSCEDFWMPPVDEEYSLPFTDLILYDDSDDFDIRL